MIIHYTIVPQLMFLYLFSLVKKKGPTALNISCKYSVMHILTS
jgi:hypothetical protein